MPERTKCTGLWLGRASCCVRAAISVHRPGWPPPDGPNSGPPPSNPTQAGCANRSCPLRPPKNLGTTLRPQPQPKLSSAGQSLSCLHCRDTYLRERDAGQRREASSRWILLDCAGSRGAPSFKTLPPGSTRWCHACPALAAPHSPGHAGTG